MRTCSSMFERSRTPPICHCTSAHREGEAEEEMGGPRMLDSHTPRPPPQPRLVEGEASAEAPPPVQTSSRVQEAAEWVLRPERARARWGWGLSIGLALCDSW